jgi:type I restriction enzyme S subunit
MSATARERTKAFAVGYNNLATWSVAAQFAVNWNWPDEIITPLARIIKRRSETALDTLTPDTKVTLLTIRFDGSIEPRKPVKIKDIKGRLFRVHPGDVVFSKIDVRNGAIGLAPVGIDDMCVTSEFPVYSVNTDEALPEYIKLLFRTEAFTRMLNAMISGTSGRKRIQPTQLEEVKVPVPPLTFQQEVVAHWEAVNTKAKAEIRDAQKTLESIPNFLALKIGLTPLGYAHSDRAFVSSWKVIRRWGVGVAREMSCQPDLTKSPFPIVTLSDVIKDLQNGWSPKCLTRPAEGEEWGVLKVGAVSFGWFDEDQNKALPPNLKPIEQYEVEAGDLIISRANISQYVGACALVDEVRPRLMLCDKLFRAVMKEDSPILPKYLSEILKIPHLRWQIENNLTGASPTMKNISKPSIMALRFPLPPLDIQERIISDIEAKKREARYSYYAAQEQQKLLSTEIEQMILGTHSAEVN